MPKLTKIVNNIPKFTIHTNETLIDVSVIIFINYYYYPNLKNLTFDDFLGYFASIILLFTLLDGILGVTRVK